MTDRLTPGMPVIAITDLLVDQVRNPLGIDNALPAFSWILESGERGQAQTAYRILVSSTREALAADQGDAWDSGVVASSRSSGVRYAGRPLRSRARYHWKVQVWDVHGRSALLSAAAWFEMALLRRDDWSAEWIAGGGTAAQGVVQLRKEFSLRSQVARARIYSSALGIYQLELNGEIVADDRLAPGWTDYRRRIQYQTYDVSGLIREGTNVIGARLARGWYSGRIATFGENLYGQRPAFLAQLEMIRTDESVLRIVTDASWLCAADPVVSADLLDGETYDALRETPGWSRPGLDSSRWAAAVRHDGPEGMLVAQAGPPVRVIQELTPVVASSPGPGVRVFDMGQNMVGAVRLKIRRGTAGSQVSIRYGEVLDRDGRVDTRNLRTARATDRYICKGGAEETYEPMFTVHGFRYAEMTTGEENVSPDCVTGRVLGIDAQQTGRFRTSSPMLNRLQDNIAWSQRGNFLSIPTDCPQRDERLGWTGDVSVFVFTAVFNTDCSRFLGVKWLADVRDAQFTNGAIPDTAPYVPGIGSGNAGWGDAIVTVPYAIWQAYGDERVITENFDAMKRWVDYLTAHSDGCRRPATGWGDWKPDGEDTPRDLVNTAHFARSAALAAEMAAAIGRDAEAEQMRQLAAQVRSAFIRAYVSEDGSLLSGTQAAYVFALSFGLLPAGLRHAAAARLVQAVRSQDWHPSTGFLATPQLLPVLSDNGYLDVAYRLLDQPDFPSWRYEVEHGATTMWEHWDSVMPDGSLRDPSMNSFNHYANGAIGSWMYRIIAGISNDRAQPGFQRIIIRPQPGGGLTSAAATFRSVHGIIECDWKLKDGTFALALSVPVNVTATVYIPAAGAAQVKEGYHVASNADGVEFLRYEDGNAIFAVGSGSYHFEA